MVWMMQRLQQHKARWQLVCEAFEVATGQSMQRVAEACLKKRYRAHLFDFRADGQVESVDITRLDPGDADERVAGWGGLTEYGSRFAEVVRSAVNEARP
jgi:hypothetical protein